MDRDEVLARHLSWLEHLPTGWHALYRELAGQLAERVPDVRVDQAKSKFGRMRVYTAPASTEASDLCRKAEQASASRCEICGGDGRLMVDPHEWYRTLCSTHDDGFQRPVPRKR